MRFQIRTAIVLALAACLLALFLHNVDLRRVAADIVRARPGWLALSLASTVLTLFIRAFRWRYLLAPLGSASFGNAFRATAVGFAATAILPARAGEVIRPYFLSRHEPMSATGAFATIILERVLDSVTVVLLLASFVAVFGRDVAAAHPVAFQAVTWAGITAGCAAAAALVFLFMLAGNPERLGATMSRLERVLPSALAGLIARVAEKFARGLGAIRQPPRLIGAMLLSFPLWLCIGFGIWAAARAFDFAVPFTGSFLLLSLLVIGVAVPTPGAVGGFHEAFRIGTTLFYNAPDSAAVGAAIVLHIFSIAPSLLLGLFFAAQEGLNVAGMKRLADSQNSATWPNAASRPLRRPPPGTSAAVSNEGRLS